jgi:hypothetical protein
VSDSKHPLGPDASPEARAAYDLGREPEYDDGLAAGIRAARVTATVRSSTGSGIFYVGGTK